MMISRNFYDFIERDPSAAACFMHVLIERLGGQAEFRKEDIDEFIGCNVNLLLRASISNGDEVIMIEAMPVSKATPESA